MAIAVDPFAQGCIRRAFPADVMGSLEPAAGTCRRRKYCITPGCRRVAMEFPVAVNVAIPIADGVDDAVCRGARRVPGLVNAKLRHAVPLQGGLPARVCNGVACW